MLLIIGGHGLQKMCRGYSELALGAIIKYRKNSIGLKYLTPVSIGLYSILTFEPILILDCPNTEAIRYEKIIQF